jgi:hypothetical protein
MKHPDLEKLLKSSFDAGKAYEKSKKVYKNQHGSYTNKKAVLEHHVALKNYFTELDSFTKRFKVVEKEQSLIDRIKSWF